MANDEKKVVENDKETTYIPEEDVQALIAQGIKQYLEQNGNVPRMNVNAGPMNPSQIAAATGIEIVEEKKTKELTWRQKGLIALGIGVAGGTAGYCIGKAVGGKEDRHVDSDTNVFGGYMAE
jgi:hypothetical protein